MDEAIQISCIIDKLFPSWKHFKHTLKHKKEKLTLVELGSHMRIEESFRVQDNDKPKSNNVAGPLDDDDVEWWVDSGATVYVCKDRCWFKTYESLNNGSILHIGNESITLVYGHGCVDLRFNSRKIVSLFNVLYVPNIRKNFGFKWLNIINDNIASSFMSTSKLNDSILWHARLGHVHFKRMQDMSKDGLIPAFDMNIEKWNKKYFVKFIDDASRFCYVYLLHTKDEALDKFNVFKTKVELQQGSLIKRFRTGRGGGAVVRLPDPKLKTLDERGIECIFVGYVEHSKAFRFFIIKQNESVLINFIIESRDAIFDENRFSSVPTLSLSISKGTEDIGDSVVLEKVTEEVVQQPEPELRKSKRNRAPNDFGPEFQLYFIKGTRDEISNQHSYCFSVEDDPKTFDEAVLDDQPLDCKPLGCKWISKRKLKVDGTIKKFKARLVIEGFRQKSWIDYFDTYAPMARISTIRLLIAMESIHNLIIHQMDVKTTFLNGELDEEVYMNQPQGFIMLGNENKVCKLIKSLYGLKHTPKQ
nr:zinc finger, CCHC-type [Tanacetum cinerariifolium]